MNDRKEKLPGMNPAAIRMSRRGFLRAAGILGGAVAVGGLAGTKTARANEDFPGYPDSVGLLTDTTMCVGCRLCETACAKAHNLPEPKAPPVDPNTKLWQPRRPNADAFTVVNQYGGAGIEKPVFRKIQCMHCNEPACVSACLVGALKKTPKGAVIYNEDVCIGCRYCMIACPFTMLGYDYDSALEPAVRKCIMCFERISKEGGVPACASVCPPKATIFGKRADLLKEAHARLYQNPNKYVDHIYGENEAGGTGWLYLSSVPFEKLGMPTNLGKTPYPEYTRDFLLGVPIMYVMWPPILAGLAAIAKWKDRLVPETKAGNHKEVDR